MNPQTSQRGYILVTALIFMTILMLMGSMIITGSVSGLGTTYTSTVRFSNFRADTEFSSVGQTYYADYTLDSTGSQNQFVRKVTTTGTLSIQMGRKYLNQFLLLADDGGSQEFNYFTTGMNYNGPVHVNKNWMFTGRPEFSMGATTSASTVRMTDCSGRSRDVSQQSLAPCTTPDWGNRSLQYSQPTITLPTTSVSQQAAALGLTAVSREKDICDALGVKNNDCKDEAPKGVYLPEKGGIYVNGNADEVVMSTTTDEQIYRIKQGSTITTITVNYKTNKTTVAKNGASVVTRDGIPNGQLYVEGQITSLKGPPRTGNLPSTLPKDSVPAVVVPAIHRLAQLNIAAKTDIVVTGDLTYSEDPRSVPDAKNVLGLVAGTGSVTIGNDSRGAPSDIYIHAAILAGAPGKGFSVADFKKTPPQGSIHLLGSLAVSKEPPRGLFKFVNGLPVMVGGYNDDFGFDQRFLNGGTVPPNFPATTRFEAKTALPTQKDWTEN
jgi:hypothetical protein